MGRTINILRLKRSDQFKNYVFFIKNIVSICISLFLSFYRTTLKKKTTRGPLVLYRSPECIGHAELEQAWNTWRISFRKTLGLRLPQINCDCREFFPKTVIYILCKINLATVFCMRQINHTRLWLSLYCIKIQVPITKEGFSGRTKSRMINCNVCISVISVVKTSWRNRHFWWYAEAKTIL